MFISESYAAEEMRNALGLIALNSNTFPVYDDMKTNLDF